MSLPAKAFVSSFILLSEDAVIFEALATGVEKTPNKQKKATQGLEDRTVKRLNHVRLRKTTGDRAPSSLTIGEKMVSKESLSVA